MRFRTLAVAIGLIAGAPLAACSQQALAADPAPIDECDRLAANPPDPDRLVAGVPSSDIDLPVAIAACLAAVEAYPQEGRFAYQLGRVYTYHDEVDLGVEYFARSAELGYRQGYFILGVLINNKRDGIEHDTCQMESYWLQAARMGHAAASISYVRHLTKGLFDGCPIGASREELSAFLEVPTDSAPDYFSRLLVTDLKEDIENMQ